MIRRLWAWWTSEVRCLGRQSRVAYLRLTPNPGLMIPWGRRRLRWSRSEGWRMTKAPTPHNPKGV